MADVGRVRESFNHVSAHGEDVAFWFYAHLWGSHPASRTFFPSDMRIQRDRFVKALVRIVSDADRVERLAPYLRQLGRNHAERYHVQSYHYVWVGESLLATLAHFLDDEWTPELEKDWADVYGLVSQIMLGGARDGYGVIALEDSANQRLHAQFGRSLFGYSPQQVEEFRGLMLGLVEQLVSDGADRLRQLEQADIEIRRLRDVYYNQNSDLRTGGIHDVSDPVVTALDTASVEALVRAQRLAENGAFDGPRPRDRFTPRG